VDLDQPREVRLVDQAMADTALAVEVPREARDQVMADMAVDLATRREANLMEATAQDLIASPLREVEDTDQEVIRSLLRAAEEDTDQEVILRVPRAVLTEDMDQPRATPR